VRDHEVEGFVLEMDQEVEERDGVGSAGNGNDYGCAGREEVLTADLGEEGFDQAGLLSEEIT
jgi:hypothetical protein